VEQSDRTAPLQSPRGTPACWTEGRAQKAG